MGHIAVKKHDIFILNQEFFNYFFNYASCICIIFHDIDSHRKNGNPLNSLQILFLQKVCDTQRKYQSEDLE